jgi:DNA adenine methylase
MISTITTSPKPFIKWVGGKSKLIPQIAPYIPQEFGTYYEPFLGGGAMFFHLQPKRAVLSDTNEELVNAYQEVRDNCGVLIKRLYEHEQQHSSDYYYTIREKSPEELSDTGRAARFIYLNKTCFNGLYRENKSGKFNVPVGKQKTPWTVDEDGLWAASEALQSAEILGRSFRHLPSPSSGDFVYFDPPYQPVSKTSDFVGYTKDGFGKDDQIALRNLFGELAGNGVSVMLSNSGHPFIREIYAQWTIVEISAARSINSVAAKRGKVGEFLVMANCP